MKKILLVTSLLVVSGVAFSAVGAEADLKVRAEVISPLSITTSPVDFGVLTKGEKNIVSFGRSGAKNGIIDIKGEAARNVKLTLGDTVSNSYVILSNGIVGSTSTLTAGLRVDDKRGGLIEIGNYFATPFTLDVNGSKKLDVVGTIDEVPLNADTGIYISTVKLTAAYDFNPGK